MMTRLELVNEDGGPGDNVYVNVLAVHSVEEKSHTDHRGLSRPVAVIHMFGGKQFMVLDVAREVGAKIADLEEQARAAKAGRDRRGM